MASGRNRQHPVSKESGESVHSRHEDQKGSKPWTNWYGSCERRTTPRHDLQHRPPASTAHHWTHSSCTRALETTSCIIFVVATYTAVCSRHQRSYAFFWVDFFGVLSMVLSQPSPVCVRVIAFFWPILFGVLSMVLSQPSPVCVSVPKARSELPR